MKTGLLLPKIISLGASQLTASGRSGGMLAPRALVTNTNSAATVVAAWSSMFKTRHLDLITAFASLIREGPSEASIIPWIAA
jgi:hypothetical protein